MARQAPTSILANSKTPWALVLHRGDRIHILEFRPWLAAIAGVLGTVAAGWLVVASLYSVFRDEMLGHLLNQQNEMQYAYEDRITAMRVHLDRVTSRQMLNQDSFETRMQDLLTRQAQLETRQTIVTALAEKVAPGQAPRSTPALPEIMRQPGLSLTTGVSAFAPTEKKPAGKPTPDGVDVRTLAPAMGGPALPDPAAIVAPLRFTALPAADQTASQAVARVSSGLDSIETAQLQALATMEQGADGAIRRFRAVLAETGLTLSRFVPEGKARETSAQGGPFVPLPGNGSFEIQVNRLNQALQQSVLVRKAMSTLPLQRPLTAEYPITSPFGVRSDPFLGGSALHTGVDFRAQGGTPARITAGGKVTEAGWNGGYGNMVEIDHGHGLSTRYAHLSSISVEVGDSVSKDDVIGRIGSTGRSTGAHLHYEVRIDGEAVDPMRFIRSGATALAAR